MALNPISFTEQVVADFLRYQLTTYPLADENLHGQMRSLLCLEESRITPLRSGPFVSLSRPFRRGAEIERLVQEGVLHEGMKAIAGWPTVRAHQENAMRAIRQGKTTLIATGTGSGKTEAFLYPIISRCLELAEAKAPPGIVAVLVYPMNALAEDQLDRLRGLLAGRGISFGLYVGKTPDEEAGVRGERLPAGSSNADYRARLKQMRDAGDPGTLIPPEERASRAAMRKAGGQPRILLTNVKQLELLLTRGKDVGLFDGAPLEYLVFDEAHTFRGAQGAETACLIRRLRAFCGKSADEVTCVATSATMADPERGSKAGIDFARRFFGVAADRVTLVGEIYDELRWNELRSLPAGPSADPAELLGRVLRAVDLPDDQVVEGLSACLAELGGARLPVTGWQKALASQLASNDLVHALADALREPRALAELPGLLTEQVGREVSVPEILCWLALGAACGRDGHEPLLRPVVHSFIRGVGGAVVTLSEPDRAARLWLAGEDAEAGGAGEFRRFPLLSCTTCGQHYYEAWVKDFGFGEGRAAGITGGDLVGTRRVWPHLAEAQEGVRVLLIDRLVVKPDEDENTDDTDDTDGETAGGDHEYDHQRLHPVWVCRACGALHDAGGHTCASCNAGGGLVPLYAVRVKAKLNGRLHSCVACQAPGRRPGGGQYREPARPVRAVSVSDVHVLAQSMLHLSERRRLLVFADNRQDAAFQAGWMRDHARRFRLRALMAGGITAHGVSIGDLAQQLDAVLERDDELSRALIPEVWQFVPKEDAGTKHREERLYFLRLQILRELTTGVKQRIGLEPWGRLRVEYEGLDENHDLIRRWADKLGCEPARLAEGIAAMLDHLRRIRLVHDEPTKMFETYWNTGDKEIQYGYIPEVPGGPRGMKLTRGAADEPGRVTQWIGARPTQIWNAVSDWGVPENELAAFLEELWAMLAGLGLIVPAKLTGWGKPLSGTAGVYQINSGKLRIMPHRGRFRCVRCRRIALHAGPTGRCLAWHCGGTLAAEEADPDDFDLRILDGEYAMLRAAEHSAQVPTELRERYENQFKGKSEQVNTLVCTPTLELGVDIGALDAVLMRNMPPGPANYWQRAGRAGRRHRMAVDITYAQATNFDQSYFRDPLKLLRGVVEPPRFNLANDVMVRKHVHATVLTALHGFARQAGAEEKARIETVLRRCFPVSLASYLFTPGGEVLEKPFDPGDLKALVAEFRVRLAAEVKRAFTQAWPPEDAMVVTEARLAEMIDELAPQLESVLRRFKRRLEWARGELARLSREESRKGVLDPEDQAHRKRCQRIIERLKGQARRTRAQAQGGADDSDTMGALAREGFLPGYGLEAGSIVGTAEPPRMTYSLSEFDLARAPTMALREYVPGNAIYANGFRFVPRRFQLLPDETMKFEIDAERKVVVQIGAAQTAPLSQREIRAVPVCDAILPSQSQISDDEEFRFQMAVSVFAMERGFHRGGTALKWGELDLRLRRSVQVRLVNVGPRSEVEDGNLGYPVCLACGQSHSPFASDKSRQDFDQKHLDRCGHKIQPTGFFADVEVDALGLHDIEDQTMGFSFMEAMRMGAARVLDMEIEDLQLLAIGRPGENRLDILMYDPMPGGSGLLDQLVSRWQEVRLAALEIVENCPGACERACIDCLQTYRNRFYHEHLDRKKAGEVLARSESALIEAHPIPEKLPKTTTTTGQPQTPIETRFKRFLEEAGLPMPIAQKTIEITPGMPTIPDFYYEGDDADEPGICMYLDGMAAHIHGNPETAEKDRFLRDQLRSRGYEVVEVRSYELDDKDAVVAAVSRIAKYLVGKEKQRKLREETGWFERASGGNSVQVAVEEVQQPEERRFRFIRVDAPAVDTVPIFDLRIAAGAFSEHQSPEPEGYAKLEGLAPRESYFIARVIGDSMDEIVPDGAWCLWERIGLPGVGAPTSGQNLVVRRPDGDDPELGRFTFKRLAKDRNGRYLMPLSSNPAHQTIRFGPEDRIETFARLKHVVVENE
ncbi:MAG TPA: DEAD/DEAH box helicase [Candidatus Ozemobacteraceae bacterium]|nr:DEAD/DEAH box helicase [Candidatus Ozemobacteraceae bacterium]